MNGTLEFDCGEVVKNVGAPGLAIKAHLFHHTTETERDRACIEDCKKVLPKYEGVIL